MGGMDGFGPVVREPNEPVFHADWERRIYMLVGQMMRRGLANIDEFRHAIERIAPAEYLASSYYERWLAALEALLAEKGVAPTKSRALPAAKMMPAKGKGSRGHARFKVGERVRARNINPAGHTRLPRYVRGKSGVVRRDHGIYVFPDTNAHHAGENVQHVYSVEFDSRELWGRPARERLFIDLWEDYLEPLSTSTRPSRPSVKKLASRPQSAKRPGR